MSAPDSDLVSDVRRALHDAAEPARAPAMQAYMKSALPFLGVPRPALRAALRPVLAAHAPTDRGTWEATVRALHDEAAYREERYAALGLLAVRQGRPWHDTDLLPLLEHLVVTGAWWDLVDEVAGHHVAPMHRADPARLRPVVLAWAEHDDLWLRRTAILAQLGSGTATDRDLLARVVRLNADRPEFWIRKALGWALRDLAHRDPDWVRAFLAEEGTALSALTRREAAKHL